MSKFSRLFAAAVLLVGSISAPGLAAGGCYYVCAVGSEGVIVWCDAGGNVCHVSIPTR